MMSTTEHLEDTHPCKKQNTNIVQSQSSSGISSQSTTLSSIATNTIMPQANDHGEEQIAIVSCDTSNASTATMSDHDTSSITSDARSISSGSLSDESSSSSQMTTSSNFKRFKKEQATNDADRLMNELNSFTYNAFLSACRPLYFPDSFATATAATTAPSPLILSPLLEDALEQQKKQQQQQHRGNSSSTALSGNKRGRSEQDAQDAVAVSTVICGDSRGLPLRSTSAVSLDQALVEPEQQEQDS